MNRKEGTKHRKRKSNKLKILFWAILFAFVSVLILYGFIDFTVGRNGEFDELATQAVRRFRREWEEWCELTLVEPYPVANLDIIEKSYDSVIIPTDRKCHYKAAIGERNKWLAENCDMMIVYIKRDYGGAYKCYKYAQELGVPIMNIADNIKNNYGK